MATRPVAAPLNRQVSFSAC